jgi:hypothetical protein
MIHYSPDGNTLIGIDDKGKEFSHNKMDGTWFSSMETTLSAQKVAEAENIAAVNDYNQKLGNIQMNVDAGRADQSPPAPAKPQQKIVSDMGIVTYVPFDPPLADLVIPKTTPTQINTPGADGLTAYDMLFRIYHHMFD